MYVMCVSGTAAHHRDEDDDDDEEEEEESDEDGPAHGSPRRWFTSPISSYTHISIVLNCNLHSLQPNFV